MAEIKATLKQRGSTYGPWEDQGACAHNIKEEFRANKGWNNLSLHQKEALDMFANKISRILTGDPDYADNWHDIAGYATLEEKLAIKKAEPVKGL